LALVDGGVGAGSSLFWRWWRGGVRLPLALDARGG